MGKKVEEGTGEECGVAFSVKVFEGDLEDSNNQLRYATKAMKEFYEPYAKYSEEYARHAKALYDSYIKAGFTDVQALILIKGRHG